MNCADVKNIIEESVIRKSTLPAEISGHIIDCAGCRAAYDSEKEFSRMITEELQSLSIPEPQISRMRERSKPQRLSRRMVAALSSAAALLLAALSMFFLLESPENSATQKIYASDGAKIIASPDADLIFQDGARQAVLRESGKLYVTIKKGHPEPFSLITSAGTILVRGTEFSVSVKEEEIAPYRIKTSVLIFVSKGTVELSTVMGEAQGRAGETLYAEDSSAPLVCKK